MSILVIPPARLPPEFSFLRCPPFSVPECRSFFFSSRSLPHQSSLPPTTVPLAWTSLTLLQWTLPGRVSPQWHLSNTSSSSFSCISETLVRAPRSFPPSLHLRRGQVARMANSGAPVARACLPDVRLAAGPSFHNLVAGSPDDLPARGPEHSHTCRRAGAPKTGSACPTRPLLRQLLRPWAAAAGLRA